MHLSRRAVLATLPALTLARCGGRPGASQVSQDAQLIVAAITPVARGAGGFGLAPAAAGEANEALAVADAEAGNLASQSVPTRIDVQEFLLAGRTLARTLRSAPGLTPEAAKTVSALSALLPVMADLVSTPFTSEPPTMSAAEARLVLRGAAPSSAPPAPPVPSPPIPAASEPSAPVVPAGPGLITIRSRYSAPETVSRLQIAIRGKGFKVFGIIDHAAAAREAGLALRPRTVVMFGNPGIGTAALRAAPTLAIDLPLRALVWESESGAVWLTENTADWIAANVYARHGVAFGGDAAAGLKSFLDAIAREATQ